jgi:hypothetical protein
VVEGKKNLDRRMAAFYATLWLQAAPMELNGNNNQFLQTGRPYGAFTEDIIFIPGGEARHDS